MVASLEEVEAFLDKLDRRHERLEDGTVLVATAPNQPPAAVRVAAPVLVLQVEIGSLSSASPDAQNKVCRRLLELNADDLLHAGYGLEKDTIVLSAAVELANLDLNELEAVLADVDMALANHVPELHKLVQLQA
jgi:hypothetical protein